MRTRARLVVLVACWSAGCNTLLDIHHFAPADAPDEPNGDAIDASDAIGDAAEMIDMPDACTDTDGDGICDADDTWPCGPLPPAPPTTVAIAITNGTLAISSITLSGNAAQVQVVPAGTNRNLRFDYSLHDMSCTNDCIDQIEYGFTPGDRVGCAFDGTVSKASGISGMRMVPMTMPAVPGAYDIRINLGQNFSCNYLGADTWWPPPPPPERAIIHLCVQ